MTTSRNHETVVGADENPTPPTPDVTTDAITNAPTRSDPARERAKALWFETFAVPAEELVLEFAVDFSRKEQSSASKTTPSSTPALSPFDAFQIMKLRRLLEAQSQFNSLGPVFMAELSAVKDYLEFIGRGSVVPALERYEYERVAGAVLGPPGGAGLPDECLVCFAGRGNRRKGEDGADRQD